MFSRVHGFAVPALTLATLVAGCRTKDPESVAVAPETSSAPPAPVTPPVDRLGDDELLEGSETAFGLPLPRELHVEGAFTENVIATGSVGVHPLVEFFRARLTGGDVREGPAAATIEGAHARRDPSRDLRIHIAALPRETRVEVRDVTPPPRPNLPDEAARWRHVGLTSDGRLADPSHMQ